MMGILNLVVAACEMFLLWRFMDAWDGWDRLEKKVYNWVYNVGRKNKFRFEKRER